MKVRSKQAGRSVDSSVLQTIQEVSSYQNRKKLASSLQDKGDTTAPPVVTKPSRNDIEELEKKLRIATQTNEQLKTELQLSQAKVVKLSKDKTHLIQKIRQVWSKLPKEPANTSSHDAMTTKTKTYDDDFQGQLLLSLGQKLSALQLDHDQLAEEYHSLRRKMTQTLFKTSSSSSSMSTTMTLRQNQVSQLQTKVSHLERIQQVHLHLLSLYRELAHHLGYHQWGKAIRQAEHELVVTWNNHKKYMDDAGTCGL